MQLYTRVMLKRKTLKQLVSLEFKSSTDLRMHASNITIYYCAYMTMKKIIISKYTIARPTYIIILLLLILPWNRIETKGEKNKAGRYQHTDKY
jgi:hypothetical protein